MIEFDEQKLTLYVKTFSPYFLKLLTQFLKRADIIEALNKNDFGYVYREINRLSSDINNKLTAILLLSGLDPLEHMDYIPDKCFYELPVTSINIPKTIEAIGSYAFAYSDVKELIYEGTEKEFNSIHKGYNWTKNIQDGCKIIFSWFH